MKRIARPVKRNGLMGIYNYILENGISKEDILGIYPENSLFVLLYYKDFDEKEKPGV